MDLGKAIKEGRKASNKFGRNVGKNFAKLELARALQKLPGWDLDDGLELMGLARRRSKTARFFSALGYLAAGAVVGAVAGMLLAPTSGREIRRTLIVKGPAGLKDMPSNGPRA